MISLTKLKSTSNYYDEIADSYNELHGEEQKKKLRLILPFIDSSSVLDVGCGTGIASVDFAVGIDPSKSLLEQNKINREKHLGNAEKLPFKDKSFDTIICITAIQHCNIDKTLKEFKRVARRKIIISVLKRIDNYENIVAKIKKALKVKKEINEEKDLIIISEV